MPYVLYRKHSFGSLFWSKLLKWCRKMKLTKLKYGYQDQNWKSTVFIPKKILSSCSAQQNKPDSNWDRDKKENEIANWICAVTGQELGTQKIILLYIKRALLMLHNYFIIQFHNRELMSGCRSVEEKLKLRYFSYRIGFNL